MAEEKKSISIAFIGDSGVGKSAFIHRHATGNFLSEYTPTVENHITSLSFVTTAGRIDMKITEYPAGENVVYEKHDAAVIMFDVTSPESYENVAGRYKKFIDANTDAYAVLCGNKVDCRDRKVLAQIKFHRGKNMSYCDVSAKSNYNFEKCFLYIIRKLRNDQTICFAAT